MERSYLQWNLVNWITVVLMAVVGIMLMGFVASGLRQFGDRASSAADV